MTWTAFLLAGSRARTDPQGGSLLLGNKALLPIAGDPMFLRPLRALLASDRVGDIIILTQVPEDLRTIVPDDPRISIRQSRDTIASTIAEMIADHEAHFPVLVTTADHALLDVEMIAEFTDKARGADLALGVVEQRPLLARFPTAKRTWIGFRGGQYSGANLFAFGSNKVLPAVERWRSVERDRKKGWRVLTALGPALLMGALLKLRTLQQSLDSIGRKLGISIRAVEMSNPLAAIDVDKVEDQRLVEAIIAGDA